ncbi:c2H2-type domain-containing protein [Trichonephila inaurata madagascariensis]|uniref:C2H2-type domain-containing protein n=1 Tax=Trichonephila inaurata madagascariensis TaxID=2747483 RepID=A0A8X7BUR4_9ARAC|nr:c2H2-type domain-containing protein [Trichonephila inaurata madagascariensis]
MSETESNIKLSWLLVSQFVSWDFCRYMSEKSDNREPDVLTFFRNVVVERTEKAASDVTKHEIIARFLMEVSTIRTLSRMPLIHKLSESVIEKCPELETFVADLLRKLEWLLETLEEDKYPGMKEEILSRISCEVNKFNNEASKNLPLPKLLEIIQTWLQLQFQAQVLAIKLRNVENVEVYRKVVDCLHQEKITSEEAKTIARVLYENKKLKKFVLSFEAETEADSQSQNQSTSSFQVLEPHPFPNECLKVPSKINLSNLMPEINSANVTQSFTSDPNYSPPVPNNQKQKVSSFNESFNPSSPEEAIEPVEQLQENNAAQDVVILNPTVSYSIKPSGLQFKVQKEESLEQVPSLNPKSSSDSDSDITPATFVSKKKRRWKNFLKQIECEEAFSDEEDYVPTIKKNKEPALCEKVYENRPMHNFSVDNNDSDTSDCDKDSDIRFLTPTMFKPDYVEPDKAPAVTLLSDYESHSSSITTNPTSTQDTDPLFIPVAPKMLSKIQLRPRPQTIQEIKPQNPSVKNKQLPRDVVNPRQMTLQKFGFAADDAKKQDSSQNMGTSKKKFKLFDHDRNSANSSNESSHFQINLRPRKQNPKPKYENLGDHQRHCKECKITFKTPTELKKHVFIEHTFVDLSD